MNNSALLGGPGEGQNGRGVVGGVSAELDLSYANNDSSVNDNNDEVSQTVSDRC